MQPLPSRLKQSTRPTATMHNFEKDLKILAAEQTWVLARVK